jgi:2-dehydropantoate 2-reductase
MNILIYGAGAVGLGIATCLVKSGENTDIIGRLETVNEIKKNGLKRTGIFGDYRVKPDGVCSYTSISEIPKERKYDYILVCTKSYDSINAAEEIQENKGLLNDNCKIVLFQNGWGNTEVFKEYFPASMIYNARVITGFIKTAPNSVDVTVHADDIHVGSLFNCSIELLEQLCAVIRSGGIPCIMSNEISKDLWAKMLYNCALNPLGAIFNVA